MPTIKPFNSLFNTSDFLELKLSAAKMPVDRLEKKISVYETKNKTYTSINTLLKQLDTSLSNIQTNSTTKTYGVTSSNSSVVSVASSATNIAPGVYTVIPEQLAQAEQITSGPFASATLPLGQACSLGITVNGATSNITINPTDNLDTICSSINSASDNPGVTASVISTTNVGGGTTFYMLLSSNKSGLINQMSFTGAPAIALLDLTNVTTIAQDAQFKFNGFPVDRPSNTVDDVLPGLTFTLNSVNASGANLTAIEDLDSEIASLSKAINDTVNLYNKLNNDLSSYELTSSISDGTYRNIQDQIRALINTFTTSGGPMNLNTLGISLEKGRLVSNDKNIQSFIPGGLTVNQTTLNEALKTNYTAAMNFLSNGSTSFISGIKNIVTGLTSSDGLVSFKQKKFTELESQTKSELSIEQRKLDLLTVNLKQKYAALDGTLSKYDKLTKYLTKLFDTSSKK